MAASAHAFALAQFAVLLLSALQARGDFLSGVNLGDATKLNPTKLNPIKLDPANLPQLPPAIKSPVEVVRAAEGKLAEGSPEQLAEDAQSAAAGVLKKGAGAAESAKPEYLPAVLSGAVVVGDQAASEAKKAASEVKKVVDGLHPERSGGVAGALRGATSQMATSVNQTSLQVSAFLRSFGPKASAMLSSSGEALACKFSGDCSASGDGMVPFDPEDPESWALYGFALFLLLALCGSSAVVLRCMYVAGRKGTMLLSEALVPLTEASAREPTIQMSHSAQDSGLLR